MRPDLRTRAVDARERMDAPDADLRMLERTYAQFPLVNAFVSGWRGLYRRELAPRASEGTLRVLDIGVGGGDLTRALARRLDRDAPGSHVVGIDVDARAVAWASNADREELVEWRCVSSADLVGEGELFDVVLSNHVLHHLSPQQLRDLLADSRRLVAPGGVAIHSDIARSPLAYTLFRLATLPFSGTLLSGSFIREDGLTSIRRSYTPPELAAVAPDGWRVEKRMPARLLLRGEEGHAGA